jgi:hypothetical protein
MKITVTNGKKSKFEGIDTINRIYIGRKNKTYGLEESHLSNPYSVGKNNPREESISDFSHHLDRHLGYANSRIKSEFERILGLLKHGRDIELVCWCKPLDCHGDVIKKRLEELL